MKPKIIYSAFLLITIFLLIPKASKANMIPNNSQILEISRNLRDRQDFFARGREQFEAEIEQLEKKRPQSVLTIENDDRKWQNFIFPEGEFTIWMPQATITEETKEPTIDKNR